ncbi:hypothetical protein Trydic_g148 [Trypoxylus dichotomus]
MGATRICKRFSSVFQSYHRRGIATASSRSISDARSDVERRCMPGTLLITIKNGRGVITYGRVSSSSKRCDNMRRALYIALIVFATTCYHQYHGVVADLEIYPGINLEDQQNEQSDRSFIQPLYAQRRWHEKDSWPRLQKEYFGDGHVQPKFNARIAERYRKIREMLNKQTIELKERLENSMKDFAMTDRDSLDDDDDFRLYVSEEVDRAKYPNGNRQHQQQQNQQQQHVLGDVRPYPPQDADFTFRDGDGEEVEDEEIPGNMPEEDNVDPMRVPYNMEDMYEDVDGSRKTGIYDAKLGDPTHFAYSPPDPRFYEDLVKPENMAQRVTNDQNLNEAASDAHQRQQSPQQKQQQQQQQQQLQNAQNEADANNRISYTGAYQEIMDDPRERTDNGVKVVAVRPNSAETDTAGVYIIAVVAGISAAATVGLIAFGIGWYNLQKHVKNASDVDYPAYGITGPSKEISPSGDRRLAQSAQMYHYQHQKQQIIAMDRAVDTERHGSVSEVDSDEENEGDYTVYEYAGLAPIGEMEVKNPLFQDDPTPAQTPAVKPPEDQQKK